MADIPALQAFAATNFIGQSDPLSAGQVRRLARHWLPEMRFYRSEHFFPVAIEQIVTQVQGEFAAMTPAQRSGARLTMTVRDGSGSRLATVDPPALYESDNFVQQQADGSLAVVLASRILASGNLAGALEGADVDGDTRLSHGAELRSLRCLSSVPTQTLAGNPTSDPDRPFRPRIDPMTVIATYVSLPEALRYELLTKRRTTTRRTACGVASTSPAFLRLR